MTKNHVTNLLSMSVSSAHCWTCVGPVPERDSLRSNSWLSGGGGDQPRPRRWTGEAMSCSTTPPPHGNMSPALCCTCEHVQCNLQYILCITMHVNYQRIGAALAAPACGLQSVRVHRCQYFQVSYHALPPDPALMHT